MLELEKTWNPLISVSNTQRCKAGPWKFKEMMIILVTTVISWMVSTRQAYIITSSTPPNPLTGCEPRLQVAEMEPCPGSPILSLSLNLGASQTHPIPYRWKSHIQILLSQVHSILAFR